MKTDSLATQSKTFEPNTAAIDADYSALKITDAEFVKIKTENLNPYRAEFRAAVLKHIQETLGADEWARLRSMAANRSRFVDRNDTADLEATPEKLLDVALSEDSISVEQTLIPPFKAKAVQIGQIEGQPVYYVDGQGMYFWGLEPANGLTLMFWATHPAYPPSW